MSCSIQTDPIHYCVCVSGTDGEAGLPSRPPPAERERKRIRETDSLLLDPCLPPSLHHSLLPLFPPSPPTHHHKTWLWRSCNKTRLSKCQTLLCHKTSINDFFYFSAFFMFDLLFGWTWIQCVVVLCSVPIRLFNVENPSLCVACVVSPIVLLLLLVLHFYSRHFGFHDWSWKNLGPAVWTHNLCVFMWVNKQASTEVASKCRIRQS